MLVVRFSDNIEADIQRGWSAWMSPGCGGTYEDCLADFDPNDPESVLKGCKVDIREFPEFPGSFGCVHHEGLSCYYLEAENVEDALKEVRANQSKFNGCGYGDYTVGNVRLLKSISKEEWGSDRDMHILEVEDCQEENII